MNKLRSWLLAGLGAWWGSMAANTRGHHCVLVYVCPQQTVLLEQLSSLKKIVYNLCCYFLYFQIIFKCTIWRQYLFQISKECFQPMTFVWLEQVTVFDSLCAEWSPCSRGSIVPNRDRNINTYCHLLGSVGMTQKTEGVNWITLHLLQFCQLILIWPPNSWLRNWFFDSYQSKALSEARFLRRGSYFDLSKLIDFEQTN